MSRETAGSTLGNNADQQSHVKHDLVDDAASELANRARRSGRALWFSGNWITADTARSVSARLNRNVRTSLVQEIERGTAFLFVPVCLAIGAVIYFTLPVEPEFLPLGLGAGVLAIVSWSCRRSLVAHLVVLALLIMVFGLIAAKFETWTADTRVLGSEITTRVTGTVVLVERRANGRSRLTIDVWKTERPNLRYQPNRVRATTRSATTHIHPGAQISGLVRLRPPPGPVRPGSYDFSRENFFDGLGANGFFLSELESLDSVPSKNIRQRATHFVANLRDRLSIRISESIGGREGAVAAALITGTKSGIPEDVNEALRRTGLAHILSISGLHMALVAGFVMLSLRAVFALFPAYSSRHPVKKYAAVAALIAVFFYLFVSGAGVATQRSFIMLAVMLVALLFDRAAITMRNLAISAIVVVLIAPHEVMGPSFQMSFAATAALIAAYAAWSERRERRLGTGSYVNRNNQWQLPRAVLRYGGGLAMTSLIAGTATALFAAYHFHRIAPYGLAANLAAMPVVGTLVMPWAVVAMLLMPFGFDGPPFAVMGWGISLVISIAEWLADRTMFDEVGLLPVEAVAVLSLGLVLLTLLSSRLRLLSVPFFVAGLALIATRQVPGVLISEDARLVAVKSEASILAVNRKRPNAFTLDNWKRALNAPTMTKPGQVADRVDRFSCAGDVCSIRHGSGALLVHVKTADAARRWCMDATVIVIDDATATNICENSKPVIITKRHLAARGAAAMVFRSSDDGPTANVAYAISEPYRPWHSHRAFSRAARGMPPWKRKKAGTSNKTRPALK